MSDLVNNEILLHQVLHGYSDGHQLLATSADLSREQESILLVMSDLSGPAFRSGYEMYLTGYSIGSGFYCFARTWFAPDLPRPGCVWTHSLLIRDEDIARVTEFKALTYVFRKPEYGEELSSYQEMVSFIPAKKRAAKDIGSGRGILAALYGSTKTVVVPSERVDAVEDLILAIVDQQWPKLRRNFKFCTGALSLRENDFDVSVSPPEVTYSVGASGLIAVPVDLQSNEYWLEGVASDLSEGGSESPFRKFLWRFGPDHKSGRKAFRPLTEIYLLINSQNLASVGDKLLSALSQFYPKSSDGRQLKREIFGQGGLYLERAGGEASALRLLVSHPLAGAIPNDVANVQARAIALCEGEFSLATDIALLAARIGGDNAQSFLEGYLQGCDSDGGFEKLPPALVPYVIERHPALLASPAAWTRLEGAGAISKYFGAIRDSHIELTDVAKAMVRAQAWRSLAAMVDRYGVTALLAVLEAIDSSGLKVLNYPEELGSVIGSEPKLLSEVIASGKLGGRSLRFLSAHLDARSWHVRRLGPSVWAKAIRKDIKLGRREQDVRSSAFFLTLGLSFHERGGDDLVAAGFSAVYDSILDGHLDDEVWAGIEQMLTYVPGKDRSKKLLRSVVRAYRDHPWSHAAFVRTFKTGSLFHLALSELYETRSGRDYLFELSEILGSGGIPLSKEQAAAFEKFEVS